MSRPTQPDVCMHPAPVTVVCESLRQQLLSLFSVDSSWDAETGVDERMWERGVFNDVAVAANEMAEEEHSSEFGEEQTDGSRPCPRDGAGWGLRAEAVDTLCREPPPAPIVELQSRLVKLLRAANGGRDVTICRMPPAVLGDSVTPLAGNAPVAADEGLYGWHIDADPALLPPSPWTDVFGRYPNRWPGKPRFVTALVYLNGRWDEAWGAPTRFLDPPTEQVLSVAPQPGRVVLMDQDITHAVTAPHASAGPSRPRYSLACKLVLHPATAAAQTVRLVEVEQWGDPVTFGSAAMREG